MIALDTNLLFYAFRDAGREYALARRAIHKAQKRGIGWGFADVSAIEFWSLAMRLWPGKRHPPGTPAEAAGFLAELVRGGAQVWRGESNFAGRLIELAEQFGVTGKRIYDLQIALTARDHGATEIWTNDHGFAALPGLRVVNPLFGKH